MSLLEHLKNLIETTHENEHRQMRARSDFLVRLPPRLVVRFPTRRRAPLRRLGVRGERNAGERLQEADEEEGGFVVGELRIITILSWF